MTDHLRRIKQHMALETRALRLAAERARLLDNSTNRGSEAEDSIRQWLRARFSPGYTISSGEIIDSFDTNANLKSRQQDGILHRNDPDANRFLLPSGMRLVPIETVAAVIEVKLTLDKTRFDEAEAAAQETARLRLRASRERSFLPPLPGERYSKVVGGVQVADHHLTDEQCETGVSLYEKRFGQPPVVFALFAFDGTENIETIRGWLTASTTISVVCSLSAGCVAVNDTALGQPPSPDATTVVSADDSLWHFSEVIARATDRHGSKISNNFHPDFSGYAAYQSRPSV